MHLDVVHFPNGITRARRSDYVAVIDVLRSTTVIARALANGAREILPVQTAAQARELAEKLNPSDVILGGEEGNAKIPGFNAGNSPNDYPHSLVAGKTIVVRTTNGTQALRGLDNAQPDPRIVCAAFANLSAVVNDLATLPNNAEITLLCCGQDGDFSLEDFLCAGAIIQALQKRTTAARLSDAAIAASALYEAHATQLGALIETGNHAQALIKSGFANDIETCSHIDTCNVVPIYRNRRISPQF